MVTTKLYTEKDIEILDDGISVEKTYFSKQDIANTFNELIIVKNFIDNQCD